MNANYTISLANWGFYLVDPTIGSGVYLQNGNPSKCSNNQGISQGDSQGMSTADKMLTAFDALIILWIFATTTMLIIMFICILKMRNERRGYSSKINDSRIGPDRDVLDEDENNDTKNQIEEMEVIPSFKESGIYTDLKNRKVKT